MTLIIDTIIKSKHICWYMSETLALKRLRQENFKFEARQVHVMRPRQNKTT